jgi:hypothetical protein
MWPKHSLPKMRRIGELTFQSHSQSIRVDAMAGSERKMKSLKKQ